MSDTQDLHGKMNLSRGKNWCTQYFCESRIKVKTNICEHNNFLNPDLRFKVKTSICEHNIFGFET